MGNRIRSIIKYLVLLLVIINISLFLIILIKKDFKKEAFDEHDINQLEDYILKYINGGDDNLIDDYSIKRNKFFTNFTGEYDVSVLIATLVNEVTNTYRAYSNDNIGELDIYNRYPYKDDNAWVGSKYNKFKLIYSKYCMYKYFESINLDKKISIEKFKQDFIKELEKCIRHTDEDYFKGWYIKGTTTGVINLPYDFYIIFPGVKGEKINDIKRITKIKFVKDYKYDEEKNRWYYINEENNVKEWRNYLNETMTYYDDNNVIREGKEINSIGYNINKTNKYYVNLEGIKYNIIYPNDYYGQKYNYKNNIDVCSIIINNYYVEKKYEEEKALDDYHGNLSSLMSGNYFFYTGSLSGKFITDPDEKEEFKRVFARLLNDNLNEIEEYYKNERKKIYVLKRVVDYE